jgi:hypothetical protein
MLFSVDVESSESAEIIYIDQVELIPGKITPLKFTINNVGSTPLKDLTFQWENEDDIILPVGSDNTKYLDYIDVGESAELKFDVIASTNADPDLYKLDLALTYDDPLSGEENRIATKAGVYVGGATDFDVAFSGESSGEYSFSIANIGSVSATSVTVKIPQQSAWRVSGSDSVIIGNLNEGDYTVASFTLQSSARQNNMTRPMQQGSQDSSLKIEIAYTDSRGNRKTVTKEVALKSSSASAAALAQNGSSRFSRQQASPFATIWNNYKWYIVIAAVLLIVIAIRSKYKKEKIKNPSFTYGKMLRGAFKK